MRGKGEIRRSGFEEFLEDIVRKHAAPSGELRRLDIDRVAGVKTVAIESLRRLPPPARVGAVPIGTWLDGDDAVLLVDLARMAV